MINKQDQIERDRLLTEVHSDIKHLLEWAKDHTNSDKEYQVKTDDTLEDLKKFKWKQVGAMGAVLAILQLVFRMFLK